MSKAIILVILGIIVIVSVVWLATGLNDVFIAQREADDAHRDVEQAQLEVDQAQLELGQAVNDTVAQRNIDEAQREVDQAQLDFERAQLEVDQAQLELDQEVNASAKILKECISANGYDACRNATIDRCVSQGEYSLNECKEAFELIEKEL